MPISDYQYHIIIHVRINDIRKEELSEFLEQNQHHYIVGQEEGHCHAIVGCHTDQGRDYRNLRLKLKRRFKVKGAEYSMSTVRDLRRCQRYVIKEDSQFLSKGFGKAFLDELSLISFSKNNKRLCMQALDKLELSYLQLDINFHKFQQEYFYIKLKYKQNLYMTHIRSYLLRMKFTICPSLYVEEFISLVNI